MARRRRSQKKTQGTTGRARQPRSRGKDQNASRKKDAKDRAEASKKNTAAWAAAGIGAAAIAGLTVAALASFVASDGATIKFKRITQNKDWFSGSQLEVTWELVEVGKDDLGTPGIPSAVQVCEGDEIEWSGTDLPKLDGQMVKVVKVKDDNVFIVESNMDDASTVDLTDKGQGIIHTDYESQLDAAASAATGGVGDALGLDTLQENLGLIFGIIGGIVGLFILIWLLSKFSSSSAPSPPTPAAG